MPKAFLPVGDSSFIRGVLVAQEGSSPEQMHAYQAKAEEVIQANPAVRHMLHHERGHIVLPGEPGFLLVFLKDPSQRPPIQQISGQLMGAIDAAVPGTIAFLQPNPVLANQHRRNRQQQGQFAYAISGINPNEVYGTADKLMAKMRRVSRIPVREFRSLQPHAEPSGGHSARPDEDSTASPRRAF